MRILPNEYTDEERQLERHQSEFNERHDKEEFFDLNDCNELDVGVVFDLFLKLRGAVYYKTVPSGYEFFDKDRAYMRCFSVKHENENVLSAIKHLHLKREI